MNYIASDNILVFPSTRRVSKQLSSRQLSESALVSIVNKLIDSDGFVITEYENRDRPFEFNIHGYYFRIDKASYIQDLFSNDNALNIYANIKLDKSNTDYVELKGQDDESVYQGVYFTKELDTTSDYSLLLFTRNDTSSVWQVPYSSRVKFTSDTLKLIIDGGEI